MEIDEEYIDKVKTFIEQKDADNVNKGGSGERNPFE